MTAWRTMKSCTPLSVHISLGPNTRSMGPPVRPSIWRASVMAARLTWSCFGAAQRLIARILNSNCSDPSNIQYDEASMSPKKETQKLTKSATATDKKSKGFTDAERAAMKDRAEELKAEARRSA